MVAGREDQGVEDGDDCYEERQIAPWADLPNRWCHGRSVSSARSCAHARGPARRDGVVRTLRPHPDDTCG
ncbi:hypothetical protein UO65_6667 [Actinokineospora spheciospongiae]|uniref:Uncharacterized protein n=1 Tax=Actinokineospora spheciospongiae TaxID=909613 RepID=W7INF4_9PSEU|nr:hypothetical protein UO65_6667 [Actinokineospora spheciospongiae]